MLHACFCIRTPQFVICTPSTANVGMATPRYHPLHSWGFTPLMPWSRPALLPTSKWSGRIIWQDCIRYTCADQYYWACKVRIKITWDHLHSSVIWTYRIIRFVLFFALVLRSSCLDRLKSIWHKYNNIQRKLNNKDYDCRRIIYSCINVYVWM